MTPTLACTWLGDWGGPIEACYSHAVLKHMLLIAEDHSYTFRTPDQRLSEANQHLPFRPLP